MQRRNFIQASALLLGGFATHAIAQLSRPEALSLGPSLDDYQANLLSAASRLELSALAEAIIPETDTAGAKSAGVPVFIEYMAQHWLNQQERAIFLAGLEEVDRLCRERFGHQFSQLESFEQLEILEYLEAQSADSPWYHFANVQRQYVEGAPFICQLKELTIFGFYSSELGAKQVLRHDPMPMQFDGEYALGEDDSSWSMIRTM